MSCTTERCPLLGRPDKSGSTIPASVQDGLVESGVGGGGTWNTDNGWEPKEIVISLSVGR